ncbi:MAG: hypothetical protein ACR2NU_11765 [Aeoliella sp.]
MLAIIVVLSMSGASVTDEPSPLRKSLDLAEWTESRFAKFVDGEPLTVDEQHEVQRLAHRLAAFDRRIIEEEAEPVVTVTDLTSDPEAHRGRLVQLSGQVMHVDRQELDAEEQLKLGAETFYKLQVAGEGSPFAVVTSAIPQAWLALESIDQPVVVQGLFVKLVVDEQDNPIPLVVVPCVAWHPIIPNPPAVNFGMSVLGTLGVDVSKLDSVKQRRPLVADDSDAFYAVLTGLRTTGPRQLIRFAERQLPGHEKFWKQNLSAANDSGDPRRRELATEVLKQANEERYSVAPFFNDPAGQVGQIASFDGVCRRAVRIVLDDDTTAAAAGVDHYYELDVFTDDSQHMPIVFCMLEIPPGFLVGENLHEPVRVAGFFFKSWRYSTRRSGDDRQRTFPLFIGRAPLRIIDSKESPLWGWIAGLGFVGLIAVVWLTQWRLARSDRAFAEGTIARMQEPIEALDFSAENVSLEGE